MSYSAAVAKGVVYGIAPHFTTLLQRVVNITPLSVAGQLTEMASSVFALKDGSISALEKTKQATYLAANTLALARLTGCFKQYPQAELAVDAILLTASTARSLNSIQRGIAQLANSYKDQSLDTCARTAQAVSGVTSTLLSLLILNSNYKSGVDLLAKENVAPAQQSSKSKHIKFFDDKVCAELTRTQPRSRFDKYFSLEDGSLVNKPLDHSTCPDSRTLSGFLRIEEIENCDAAITKAVREIASCPTGSLYAASSASCTYLPKPNSLEANLQLGKEILADTLDTILFSSNNLARSRMILKEEACKQNVNLQDLFSLYLTTHKCLLSKRFATPGILESRFAAYKVSAKIANDMSIGNCGEMAEVALFKGIERGIWDTHLDVIYIVGGDHEFVVLGRQPGSDPNDYKKWGPSAVVIDPWAGKVFALSEVETKLKNYVKADRFSGEPTLKLFNPKTQRLSQIFGNIFFREDLLANKQNSWTDEQAQAYDAVGQLLDQFHHTPILQEKVAVAQDLHTLCHDPKINSFSTIDELRDQIAHFIELSHMWTATNI